MEQQGKRRRRNPAEKQLAELIKGDSQQPQSQPEPEESTKQLTPHKIQSERPLPSGGRMIIHGLNR